MTTYKKKMNPTTGELDLVVDVYTETDPLSLHLDQSSPQTFANLGGGTGLMKVTAGLLGLDTSVYLTAEADTLGTVTARGATTAVASTFSTAIITPKIYPEADSTTAVGIFKADGVTNVLNVNTTNARIGIGTTAPGNLLSLSRSAPSASAGLFIDNANTSGYSVFRMNSGNADVGVGMAIHDFGSAWGDSGDGSSRRPSQTAFANWGANGISISAENAAGVIDFLTAGATIASNRMRITAAGNVGIGMLAPTEKLDVTGNIKSNATFGAEFCPNFDTANWTEGSGWTANGSTIERVSDPAATNITQTGGSAPTQYATYKIVMTVSAVSGVFYYSYGGVESGALTATTMTNYITTKNTAKLVINAPISGTITITAISIKLVTDATGDVTLDGNLTARSNVRVDGNIMFGSGTPRARIEIPADSSATDLDGILSGGVMVGRTNELYQYTVNGASSLYLNYRGYLGSNSQFRDTYIGDGKLASFAMFRGNGKCLEIDNGATTFTTRKLSIGTVSTNTQVLLSLRNHNATTAAYPYMRFILGDESGTNSYTTWYGVSNGMYLYNPNVDFGGCIGNKYSTGAGGFGGATFTINSSNANTRGAQFCMKSASVISGTGVGGLTFVSDTTAAADSKKSMGGLQMRCDDDYNAYGIFIIDVNNSTTGYPTQKFWTNFDSAGFAGGVSMGNISNYYDVAGDGLSVGGSSSFFDTTLGSEILTGGSWTLGADWADTGTQYSKTGVGASTLSYTYTALTIGQTYKLLWNHYYNGTACTGKMSVAIGGKTFRVSGANVAGYTRRYYFTATSASTTIVFTPEAGWYGKFDYGITLKPCSNFTTINAGAIRTSSTGYFGGSLTTNGGILGKITTVTTTYTVLVTDETVIGNSTTAFVITLPTATVGQVFEISNINTGTVTLDGSGTDTISGAADVMLGQWDSVKVRCYIANKWVIQ